MAPVNKRFGAVLLNLTSQTPPSQQSEPLGLGGMIRRHSQKLPCLIFSVSVKCSLFFNPVFLNVVFCPNLPLELFWEEPRFLLGLCARLLADCPQRVSFKAGLWTVNRHTFLKSITTRDLVGVDLLWFLFYFLFSQNFQRKI